MKGKILDLADETDISKVINQILGQMPRVMVIMRGMSGSGKSTMAIEVSKKVHGIRFSTDFFWHTDLRNSIDDFVREDTFQNVSSLAEKTNREPEGKYEFDMSRLHQAHQWDQRIVKTFAEEVYGYPIIVDNTNLRMNEFKAYLDIADKNGYNVVLVEPSFGKTDGKWDISKILGKTTHGVPDEAVKNMVQRYQRYTGV